MCLCGEGTERGNWVISAQRIRKVGGADYLKQEVIFVATGPPQELSTLLTVMSNSLET